jgi:hypothetical protein
MDKTLFKLVRRRTENGKRAKTREERGERARASKKGLMGSKSYALDGVGVL